MFNVKHIQIILNLVGERINGNPEKGIDAFNAYDDGYKELTEIQSNLENLLQEELRKITFVFGSEKNITSQSTETVKDNPPSWLKGSED